MTFLLIIGFLILSFIVGAVALFGKYWPFFMIKDAIDDNTSTMEDLHFQDREDWQGMIDDLKESKEDAPPDVYIDNRQVKIGKFYGKEDEDE
jgi:hypothetical protein